MNILKLFSSNERDIKRYQKIVNKINALEPTMQALSNDGLRAKTDEFKARLANGETLEDILPEAFAACREAGVRALGMRHFDVQLMGALVLNEGRIAEMKTGEGKTLVATLALYLNALTGKGAHLVTVNDYLSKRDAKWNGPLYHLLGISVGSIHGQSAETGDSDRSFIFDPDYVAPNENEWDCLRPISRQEAYACDVTYGTNHEFGFDYLRDNMAFNKESLVQRELNFAIVDEVDSILIDEARTPLIISGIGSRSSDMYVKMDAIVRRLSSKDFTIDEKAKTAMLTEDGTRHVEELTGCGNLSDPENLELNQYVNAALKAHAVFKKDIDYVVKDGQVVIVDEFTGRLMFGRRWSDGLHQAVEAKEGVKIAEESQTLATVTYQNFFRLYDKLSGMTGTAKTEEDEFRKIYALDVVEVPTNRPVARRDYPDVVFKSEEGKFRGMTAEALKCYVKGQPVLLGTRSIEVSERISERFISERLQLLGATIILHEALDNSKLSAQDKDGFHKLLNFKFSELNLPRITKVFKALDMNPDMLCDANIALLAKELKISPTHYDKLREALKEGIYHSVLNAKYHEREAEIISEAGKKYAVTIATNMAGRGVDILLGGTGDPEDTDPIPEEDICPEFKKWKVDNKDKAESLPQKTIDILKLGGLCIIGSERHESRRIDNQLRGRSGRQGDTGSSKFFVSLEDELWRLFGDKSNSALLATWREDQAIDAKLLSKMIERAQKKVEMHHFDIRKHVLQYDDVMNVQRETIYGQRREILYGVDLRETIISHLREMMENAINNYCPESHSQAEWDTVGLFGYVNSILPLELNAKPENLIGKKHGDLYEFLCNIVDNTYADKEAEVTPELMRDIERHIALDLINRKWIDHLSAMDFLREGIGLRGYGQKDPIVEYKKEAYDLFQMMIDSMQDDLSKIMYRVRAQIAEPRPMAPAFRNISESSATGVGSMSGEEGPAQKTRTMPKVRERKKVGRNDPCPCGSGKKYKKCCMLKDEAEDQ